MVRYKNNYNLQEKILIIFYSYPKKNNIWNSNNHIIFISLFKVTIHNFTIYISIALTNLIFWIILSDLLGLTYRQKNKACSYFIDILAVTAQFTGLILWPLLTNSVTTWLIPLAVLLTSCRWWENYVCARSAYRPIRYLSSLKNKLSESRYHIYVYLSVAKCFIFACIGLLSSGINVLSFFANFTDGWNEHTIQIIEV